VYFTYETRRTEKEDLICLSEIFSVVEDQPYRFMLLCDDLTFEPGELSYKMLKNAAAAPPTSFPSRAEQQRQINEKGGRLAAFFMSAVADCVV